VAGYFLVDVVWTEEEGHRRYVEQLGETLDAFGGEYVARGPEYTSLEGDWKLDGRLVLLRFASAERAMEWYHSDVYAPLLALRKNSARTRMLFFEGS
jgi:uncharacterized protein (DUF1330 family)